MPQSRADDGSRKSAPGYPLESPSFAWKSLAISAYTMSALIGFRPEVLPQPFMNAVYALFRDHDTITKFGIGAVAIHVGYAIFVAISANRRNYDARATAWWAAMSFAFGFLGVKLFLDKDTDLAS